MTKFGNDLSKGNYPSIKARDNSIERRNNMA